MLDDRHRRRREFGDQLERGVGVGIVVVRQLLAVQLPGAGDTRTRLAGAVERAHLMRVLAIAQDLAEPPGDDQGLGEGLLVIARQPSGDRRIIGRGRGIGLAGETAAQRRADRAVAGLELGEHALVIGGIGHHRDRVVVLGRGADQRDAADIDVFDAVVAAGAGGDGLGKRVEIADQQIDRLDPAHGQGGEVVGPVAARQQPAMDRRVQGLDPAVEKFGHAGDRRHLGDREPGRGQGARTAAGRDQGDAARRPARRQRRRSRSCR